MSGEAKAVPVNIMGREYRVSCTEDEKPQLLEAHGLAAVLELEHFLVDERDGLERIAVMAALNIAHEYLTTRVGGGFDIADFRRRISGMEATIDQAVADQDELF
jgi:cell division protein ZapA